MPKPNPELQALELLKSVLPKTVSDGKLVEKIYSACEKELQSKNRQMSFQKFCARTELLDLKKESVAEIKQQFEERFGKGAVSVVTHPDKKAATVEVVLDDQTFEGVIKVGAKPEEENGDPEFKPKFVAFPVALHTDPELTWTLGRTENLTPEEAAMALDKAHGDFWASKAGQKLIKERVERNFPEFISRVPAKLLTEVGLKRHYKEPEPLKQIRPQAK